MRRVSDRFAEAAAAVADLSELRALLGEAAAELGFHYFALLDHCRVAEPGAGRLRLDNYPEDWVQEWTRSGFGADDPVHLASLRANTAFSWSELDALIRLESRHQKILARGRYHGLGGGFTVPANVPGEPSASCSFALRVGSNMPVSRLHCAAAVGAHALRAARRLRSVSATSLSPRPRLSRREVQCLQLVAMGKTDWEIARILGLSVETARQYVKRARAAYDAVSRTQLVVYGLRDAWISFEDAIPPYG